MDGQRLILVSGAYGAAGSEYRTELDSFSKIVKLKHRRQWRVRLRQSSIKGRPDPGIRQHGRFAH